MIDHAVELIYRYDDNQSRRSLLKALETRPEIRTVWGNLALCDFDIGVECYSLPFYFLEWVKNWNPASCHEEVQTLNLFNFMINKKMPHRYLVLRLIEYFDLTGYDYTYSGSCLNINDDCIFLDLDQCDPKREIFTKQIMMEILGSVTIPPKFLGVKHCVDHNSDNHGCSNYGGNYFAWKSGLDQVFSSALVSLITESDNGDYDFATNFTEKTLYAVLGLTIPMWPGGYRHAEMFERMGFDVFSDLIDHSYQTEKTMFMRCWRAFKDNLDFLKNTSSADKIRKKIMPRLLRNREYLFSEKFVDWYHASMETWPLEIRYQVYQAYKFLDTSQRID